MPTNRYIILVCITAFGLALAGCDERSDGLSPAEKPAARSGKERTGASDLNTGDMPKREQPATAVNRQEVRKQLDLSMPPQPKVDLGSFESTRPSAERILPDLFDQEQEPDERSIRLKGRVLMEKTGREDLDSIEGGQVTIEMKNR